MRELFALLYSLPMCALFRLRRPHLLFEKYYKWLWFKNTSGAREEELRLNSFESVFESTVQIILMTFSSWTRWSRFLSAVLQSDPRWQDGKNKTARMEWEGKVCWEFWIQRGGSWEDHLWQFSNVENCSKLSERGKEVLHVGLFWVNAGWLREAHWLSYTVKNDHDFNPKRLKMLQ